MFSTIFQETTVLLVSFKLYLSFITECLSNGLIISFGTRTDLRANAYYAILYLYFLYLFKKFDFWLIRLSRLKFYRKTKRKAKNQLVMFIATGIPYNEKDTAVRISTFVFCSLLKLAFVSMEWFFSFFNTGNTFVLMEENSVCQQPCSESYRSNEVLHSLVCVSEKVQEKPLLVFKGILVELRNWNPEE